MLIADSAGPIIGGFLSASSATVYIESTVSKAKTGLAAVVTGLGFLALMWLSPLASVVPAQATAPALILIGFLMFRSNVPEILSEWQEMNFADQFAVGVPAVLTMLLMPFSYSITAGIGVGFICYTVLQLLRGRIPHWMMIVLSVLFVIFFLYHV